MHYPNTITHTGQQLYDAGFTDEQAALAAQQAGLSAEQAGIQTAIKHANSAHHQWSEQAYNHFKSYITLVNTFVTEDFRAWCADAGLAPPPDNRAFGGILVRASNAGLIEHFGYEKSQNPKAHRGTISRWKVVEFEG